MALSPWLAEVVGAFSGDNDVMLARASNERESAVCVVFGTGSGGKKLYSVLATDQDFGGESGTVGKGKGEKLVVSEL